MIYFTQEANSVYFVQHIKMYDVQQWVSPKQKFPDSSATY